MSASRVERRIGVGSTLVAFTAVDCVALASVCLLDPRLSHGSTIAGLSVLWFFNGLGASATTVIAVTMRQVRTPAGYLGRINAGIRWISYGAIAVGAALGGLAGTALGVRGGLVIGGSGYLLTLVWVVASPLRSVHRTEDVDSR
jgi:predicted MFS family arabinose efflux permease